jgi:hypothetical protein
MRFTVYGIVVESNYCFEYFKPCSDLLPPDIYVDVSIDSNADIPYVRKYGDDWFEISQPNAVIYRYIDNRLDILARSDKCVKSTISSVPFFMSVYRKGGVLLHASCVMSKVSKKAAIIAAPSGVGKSTIADFLSIKYKDVFEFVSDDAAAVYMCNKIPYVYNGPSFSKADAVGADLIGLVGCEEKNIDNNKFLINRKCNLSKINSTDELKIEAGALFFAVSIPASEKILTKEADYRSAEAFIKASIVSNRYNLSKLNNFSIAEVGLICSKIKTYILYYPQKKESLNDQLYEAIHEKILR